MSDTDDTDVLLLIPPNFFRVRTSDSDESFVDSARTVIKNKHNVKGHILNTLITQVKSIETRLENLESSSTIDITSLNRSSSLGNVFFGNIGSERDLSINGNYMNTPEGKLCNLNLSTDGTINHTFPKRKRRNTRRLRSNLSSSSSFKSQISLNSTPSAQLLRSRSRSNNIDCKNENFVNHDLVSNEDRIKSVSVESKLRSSDKLFSMAEENDTSTIISEKYDDAPMLSEIDQFLNRVEMFERSINSSEKFGVHGASPRKQFSTEDYNLATNNYLEVQDSPKSYLQKYIYLTSDSPENIISKDPLNKHIELKSAPDISSDNNQLNKYNPPTKLVENAQRKSPTVRRLQYPESISLNSNTSTPNERNFIKHKVFVPGSPIKSVLQEKAESLIDKHRKMMNKKSSDENTKNNHKNINRLEDGNCDDSIKENPTKTMDLDSTASSYFVSGTPQKDLFNTNNEDRTFDSLVKYPPPNYLGLNLMSLADLWNSKTNNDDNNVITKQRFEEERLKRQHCENLIQQLQKKHLEQQQKIAVAISIDKAKDEAINKLKDAWLRLSASLTEMDTKHRSIMDRMTNEMKMISLENRDNFEKARHYERELTKALDLAHDYQEKCKLIRQNSKLAIESAHDECKKFVEQLNEKDKMIAELKDSHSSVVKLNKQFTDCVDKLEQCIEKEKSQSESLKVEMDTLKTSQGQMQNEVIMLEQNRDNLRKKLEEEIERNISLVQSGNETKLKINTLEEEVQLLKKQAESQKFELKAFYQKQLEEAVLSKLKEFQSQLDEAEKIMANDLREKQKSVSEAFAKQIQLLESEHKKDIARLEDTQREEVKLYRLQLAQSNQKVVHLEDKLQAYRNKRGQIATQLHQVMESQWQQALRILTAGVNTPSGSSVMPSNPGKDFPVTDNLDSRQLQTYLRPAGVNEIDNRVLFGLRSQSEPFVNSNVRGADHRRQRGKEDFVTPVSSKREKDIVLSDNDMQKYIKLLLSKSPNELDSDNPQTDTTDKTDRCSPESNCADLDSKERPTSDRQGAARGRESQGHNSLKPPWK